MNPRRGEVWLAQLDPTQGSEQAGTRPVLVLQDNAMAWLRTVVVAPLTSNLQWARFPFCVLVSQPEGGLRSDSVLLVHQTRVLDKTRLRQRWGMLNDATMQQAEAALRATMGL